VIGFCRHWWPVIVWACGMVFALAEVIVWSL
jgi:hypothetical protein